MTFTLSLGAPQELILSLSLSLSLNSHKPDHNDSHILSNPHNVNMISCEGYTHSITSALWRLSLSLRLSQQP